ncbi:MAG: hypothetical protein IPN01_19440 [Deltaproteobacteria bacterium]|nr:hypothetical protein [Deltaproteobacteria bacterium]
MAPPPPPQAPPSLRRHPRGEEVDALLARLTAFSGSVVNGKKSGTCPSS